MNGVLRVSHRQGEERALVAIYFMEQVVAQGIQSNHFIGSSLSKDPKEVNYIPTLFGDRKRRINTPNVGHDQLERVAK